MRASVVTALLAVSLSAAACSGGESATEPTLPPVTTAPSPTPGTVPGEAAAATPEGAAEFVRFFYAELERAYVESDPDVVAAVSAQDCASCTNFIDSLTNLRDSGDRVDAFTIEVVEVVASAVDPEAATTAAVVSLNVGEYVRRTGDGTEVAREPAAAGAVNDVILVRSADGWLVQAITR